jgi:ferredoxin/MoaA/NifB/PqqE/SkfB family radical SAM enzyme
MTESIDFHTDLYRRDALELTAQKYHGKLRVELADADAHVVARLQPLTRDVEWQELRGEFCNEVFSATTRRLRDLGAGAARNREQSDAASGEPPWELLAPFSEGAALSLGWVLESLSPVRGGSVTMVLRHARDGIARVAIRRHSGAPLGVAHTDSLDFLLMNGGCGTAHTDAAIGTVLTGLADALRQKGRSGPAGEFFAALVPHTKMQASQRPAAVGGAVATPGRRRIGPRVDRAERTIAFDFDDAGVSRLALYDAVLAFADRCYIFLTRHDKTGIEVQLKPRGETSDDTLRLLVRDVTDALNRVAGGTRSGGRDRNGVRSPLPRRRFDVIPLLAELVAADPATLGLGFQPERGRGHGKLRVLNVRGTGACNSDCLFCIEKFNPTHRPTMNADATRQLILDSANRYDMLFFASGEPTIHPKLFEYVDLAKSVGFSCFGMSSHFRTFADPHFALKTLQAGFEYFDISLHAADLKSQLEVNPIEDDGQSLFEALKGLAILMRLADTLGIRINITHKVVVSRLNVTQLEAIFRATYDRGVRHFILQPVRALGLAPERQAKLEISEDEMLPHLNDLLRRTQGLGATIKPYGFSRQNLFAGSHVEFETNRVKNIYGKVRRRDGTATLPATLEERPTDGRHWVEIRDWSDGRLGFASDGKAPVLDDALRRGARLSFGCRMGSCGMCCARLLEGRVDQSTQIFLSEEQIERGYVLLCQSRPLSDVIVEVCREDEIDEL